MNPCCCWNLKDGCITVGIWSLVFCIIQLGIFGWQTAVIKAEKDKAGANLLPIYGDSSYVERRYPAPWERGYISREEKFWTGLFVVQILVLIVSFFLLFASVALIYGVHTNSKYLVWPWFPCMITNILCCIAYCILWWTGDVRNYWMVLTIIEMIGVFINVYCLICVIVQYRRIAQGRGDPIVYDTYYPEDPYKTPVDTTVYYNNNNQGGAFVKTGAYDPYDPQGQLNQGYYDQEGNRVGVYPYDPATELPQKAPLDGAGNYEQDEGLARVGTWVDSQQQLAMDPNAYVMPAGGVPLPHANSEPVSPVKEDPPVLHPSKSVPSVLADEKLRKKSRHRSSSVGSRSRKSRRSSYSDSDSDSDGRSRSSSRYKKRHGRHSHSHSRERSRSKNDSESDYTYSDREGRRHKKHRHRRHRKKDDDDDDRRSRRHRRPRDVKRDDKDRDRGEKGSTHQLARPGTSSTTDQSSVPYQLPPKYSPNPGAGGITIPQHIVIPPTQPGDKSDKPQRFHINSEITISYSDRSTNPSDSEVARRARQVPQVTMRPAGPSDDEAIRGQRESYGAESSDSKGYGSTAV